MKLIAWDDFYLTLAPCFKFLQGTGGLDYDFKE